MNTKLIAAAAAGLLGYGALWGWAITADHYEQQKKEVDKALDDLDATVDRLTERVKRSEALLAAYDNSDQIDPKIIENARLHSVSLDPEPGPGGGQIISVTPIEEVEGEEAVVEFVKNPRGEETSEDDGTGDEEEPSEEEIEESRSRLQSLIDTYTADPDVVDQFVNTSAVSEVDKTPPFVISRMKYSWDEEEGDDYAKIMVTYYPRERVVLDDDQDVMEDVANTLGWKNLNRFGDESGDADVVFIRNRRLLTDFEVVRDDENPLPLHVKYGMGKAEFETNKAAGLIKFRPEDRAP